jgi:hypothetical protein
MKKTDMYRKQHNELVKIVKEIEDKYLALGQLPAASQARETLNLLSAKISVHLTMEDSYSIRPCLNITTRKCRKKPKPLSRKWAISRKLIPNITSNGTCRRLKKPDAFIQET